MQARIETIKEKKLAGKHISMSLTINKTEELWKSFMRYRNMAGYALSEDLISLQVYPSSYFTVFNPDTIFEKWALAGIPENSVIPDGMEPFTLPGGLYAVFDYKGPGSDNRIFQYIFGTWLPESGYLPDNRPYFEVLGKKYRNNAPDSDEEIWIPIKTVNQV